MSYSVCLNCKDMVQAYDKYCVTCQKQHHLPDDPNYWRDVHAWPNELTRNSIVESDKKKEGPDR